MSEAPESGIKWWMRYVVVPLIGGGGLIAILVANMEHPRRASESTQTVQSATKPPAITNNQQPINPHRVIDFHLSTTGTPQSPKVGLGNYPTVIFGEYFLVWEVVEPAGKLTVDCDAIDHGKPNTITPKDYMLIKVTQKYETCRLREESDGKATTIAEVHIYGSKRIPLD